MITLASSTTMTMTIPTIQLRLKKATANWIRVVVMTKWNDRNDDTDNDAFADLVGVSHNSNDDSIQNDDDDDNDFKSSKATTNY
mmetsp:Transcript_34568/g.37307  ORF Transcript_34568/g.37307 Transcript_34568/m.37307 type:complete len:84 (+) Transcript_34568:59-310(+)